MIAKDLLWTGDLNELAAEGVDAPKAVGLYDTTLRDGEQTVGTVLDPDRKLEIARSLDSLGIQRIEAGFPRVSAEDREAVAMILDAGLGAEVWGFSRAHPKDLEELLELGVGAAVIEAPVSARKLAAYGMTEDMILDRVGETVQVAADAGMTVAFFGVDGTRAEIRFLERMYVHAIDRGAKEVAIVDTLGVATPEAAAYLVGACQKWTDGVPVHWHGHNDFGLATAAAVAAVRAGATWIHGTINGMGERAGNANLGEVALALEALYGIEVGMRFDRLLETAALVKHHAGYELEPWKPVVGKNLFVRESGAVAAQFHDPSAIEPYSAEVVGARREVVLGKKSGLASLRVRGEQLGLDLSDSECERLLPQVKSAGVSKRGLLGDDEFRQLVAEDRGEGQRL